MLAFLPGKRGANPLTDAWLSIDPDAARIATAFASEAGAYELRERVIPKTTFDAAEKQWLVGIQDGITQPKALERLGKLDNSEVRVPFGTAAIADPSLQAPTFFHPKLYYFENSSTEKVAIVSTSANLTLNGLKSNVEQSLIWQGRRTDAPAKELNRWWDELWRPAEPATSSFIAAYEAKRPRLPLRKRPLTQEPPDSALRKASSFWIELTRKPEGGSYNQVELLFNGHLFFYPTTKEPSTTAGRRLSFEDTRGNVYNDPDRQVCFTGRYDKGNGMWRVYMPTLHMGFTGYQDGDVLIRFTRTNKLDHYLVEVAASDSPRALAWMQKSTVAEHPGPPPHRMGWA